MLSREELLETVNDLNRQNAGRQVGSINGYRDQWFIGGSIYKDRQDGQELLLHFCQGRNVGRINFNGGYTVTLNVTDCRTPGDVFKEFELLDHHKRREKEKTEARQAKLEARCTRCASFLAGLTRNCAPSDSCGYKRIRKRKRAVATTEELVVEATLS